MVRTLPVLRARVDDDILAARSESDAKHAKQCHLDGSAEDERWQQSACNFQCVN